MKKLVKTLILLPMWPSIWLQMGFQLKDCADKDCCGGGCSSGCCRRAEAMVRWWKR